MPDPIEKTAIPGSDPGEGQKPDPPTGKGADSGTSPDPQDGGKSLPYDKDPKWIAARAAEKALGDVLKANDLDDIEDLKILLESGKKVHGKIANLDDIDTLIAEAEELKGYKAYWKEQEELKKRSDETAEQTIERLEKEKKALETKHIQIAQAEDSKKAVDRYYKSVETLVDETLDDLPKDQRAFVLEFFGVGNPFTDIDIEDRRAVARMVKSGVKKLDAFKQQIIKDYIDGKDKIPPVSSSGEPAVQVPEKIKLRDARKIMRESWKPW